ncbi:hypothetical protein PHISP_03810 [Aspergillus sp. HF37]|nr:hypothetical protein PHISP_03810 [Aspergillus sp. HF37]
MSTSTDSSREYQDLVTQSTPQPYGVPPRRRRNQTNTSSSKSNRFYSSPLNDSPDSTPLQVYGLEQREPSISEKPRNRHLQRVSYALGDIKEDFSTGGQLSPRTTADRIKRRTSVFISEGPASSPSPSPRRRPSTPMTSEGQRSRPMSILSLDALSSPPQRLGRRLSSLSSFSRRKGSKPQEASISQPNLIGSSTQL